ncbi:MAG: hypothetical protein HXY40_11325 [Chloroflexi bacterium]|nr:hypothetical protein [Chloroflexota bacterium]
MILRLSRRLLRFILIVFARLLLIALLLVLLQYSTPPLSDPFIAITLLTSAYQFDYIGWEAGAIAVKTYSTLYGLHPFMNEQARSDYVRVYMHDLRRAQQIEAQIDHIYSDPSVSDPETASAGLRAERDLLRADLRARQILAESILEGQVAAVLVEQGFGALGQLWPPLSAHFTQVPNLLVISPRETIRFDYAVNLVPLAVDTAAALETRVEQQQNVSALIVPLGGLALYPSMILETSDIVWAVNVIAHEWLHHYLFFYPLGLGYVTAGETRIINETTARLFGEEIGPLVLRRYYPDLYVPPPQTPQASAPVTRLLLQPIQPAGFDFGVELGKTRFNVDRMLAAGQVVEAESYMEARRSFFAENGYFLRRLNQAYFAFYGGYQSRRSGGAGGGDPIGPAVAALRAASPSLLQFVVTMRDITTREQLLSTAGN